VKRFLASVSLAVLALASPVSDPQGALLGSSVVQAQSVVTLENLSFKGEVGSVSIPKITVEGTTATKAEIEALFDAKTISTVGSRLAKISARSISIPLIEIRQEMPEATAVTSYRDVVLRDMRNGVVTEGVMPTVTSKATAKAAAKDFPGFEMTMEKTTMKGFDIPLWFRFVFDKAAPNEALKVGLVEQVTGKTVYKIGDIANFTFNEVSMKDLKVRALKTPLMDLIALGEQLSKDKSKEGEKRAIGMMADMLGAMSVGSMELKGMSGDVKAPGKPPVKVSMDRMAGAGGADIPGRFTMQGLKIANGNDIVNMGEITIDGVSLASMVSTFEKLGAAADPKMADIDPASFIPKIDLIRIAGIDIDVPDTKDAKQRIKAKLGLFETKMGNHVGAIPANIAIALDRIQMDIPANTKEKGLRDLLDLGYKALDISARYDQAWDQATKTLKLNEFSLRSTGMFAAKASAEIGNVPKELFTADKAVAAVAALGVSAKSVNLHVTNESLFEKLIAKQAKDTKRKVEDLRAELAAGATLMVPMMLGDHPAAKTIGAVLGKFVADPKTLKMTVTAKGAGIGATDFIASSNPMDLLKKVDITASANE
jgi:hypothetical protein